MKETIFAGSGGQGALTVGLIIPDTATTKGTNVTWVPSYSSTIRSDTANYTVKYYKNTIYNPSQEQLDLLLAMNNPSSRKFLPLVAPDGAVVTGDLMEILEDARKDMAYMCMPATRISTKLNNPKGANTVMIGTTVKLMDDFIKRIAIVTIIHTFGKKGKPRSNETDERAFNAGYGAMETLALDSCVR